MTLSHKTHLAIRYIGSKGRKVAWTEDYSKTEVFIPKYREPEVRPIAPRTSKYQTMVLELKERFLQGEKSIDIPSENPYRLARNLRLASEALGIGFRFSGSRKTKKVLVLWLDEKTLMKDG